MTDTAIAELAPESACATPARPSARPQASYYRRHRQSPPPQRPEPIRHRDRHQPRALSQAERHAILDVAAQRPVRRYLTDRGVGHAARRRRLPRLDLDVLPAAAPGRESRERRRQATHPATVKPELVAYHPNSVWSWDITKLRGPAKWTLLLPVRDLGHLLPVRGRLDGRHPRIRGSGRGADPPDLRQAGHRPPTS